MPEDLLKLIVVVGLSLIVSFIIVTVMLIWRLFKRKPLLPIKDEKIQSPAPFYIGILLSGGFSLVAFLINKPYFGSAILLMLIICIFGLIAYKKGRI